MLPFELLHTDVDYLKVSTFDKEFFRSRLKDSTFHHIMTLVNTLEKNLPKEEYDALKIFLKNKLL